MNNKLFKVYANKEFQNQTEVYDFLAKKISLDKAEQEVIIQRFFNREQIGSIQISEKVIMPHFVASGYGNHIFLIRPKIPISNWSTQIGDVSIIIVIIFEENVSSEIKSRLNNLIKNLMNPEFITLLEKESQNNLINKLNEL